MKYLRVKDLLTVLLMLLSFTYGYSQKDFKSCFIVNNHSDTIFGTGNISKNQEYCMFKKFDANEFKKLYPQDIHAFRIIGGKYYLSQQITENDGRLQWYFLEFLVDGKIDLFTITSSVRFFIKKENEPILELKDKISNLTKIDGSNYNIKDKRFIGQMKVYMSEAPALFPEIDNIDNLHQRDLVKLSMDYHKAVCNEYECVNYTKNIPNVTYKIEVLTGVNHHNNFYTPQFGILVHIWRPLRNERLYLKTGVLYSTRPYYKRIDKIEDKADYSIKIPFSFEYVFGKKALKPTLAIGFSTGIFLCSSFQAGFTYTFSEKFEFCLNGSVDGLLSQVLWGTEELFNNNFGHSLSSGLIYKLN